MSILDAVQAIRVQLDAIAASEGVAIAHEARDQDLDLPRIEVFVGTEFSQTVTHGGDGRYSKIIQATVVTKWGDGTAQAEQICEAIRAAFGVNSFWERGRIIRPVIVSPAFQDQAERRQPISIEIDYFS